MDKSAKDLMNIKPVMGGKVNRSDSEESTFLDDMDHPQPESISRRRGSLIEQFRDFLKNSVDFSFKIDDPFEKEMY